MKCFIFMILLPFCLYAQPASVKMHVDLGEGQHAVHGSRYKNFSSSPGSGQKKQHFKGKALCMVSPPSEPTKHPYLGLGVSSKQSKASSFQNSLEGVVGYEFQNQQGHQVTTQVETSQPKAKDPTVRFYVGLGF